MSAAGGGPPRLARALLELLSPHGDAGVATGDLDEEYARFVRPARGRLAADLWYWRQVLLSAPRLFARRRRERESLTASIAVDVRFAARRLRRHPGFTLAAVATLALGLGVNAAVFSVLHAVLLRPLPYAESGRLVRPVPDELFFLDSEEALLLDERMTTLESFASWGRTLFLFTGGSEAEEVRGARVSWNHFDVLGVEPLLGRTFVREDAEADDALVLSHRLWTRRFGADPAVVGSTVELHGRTVTIVGVLRPEHVPLEFDWEAWRTLPLDPALSAGSGLAGTGRMRPGVELSQVRDELRGVLPGIRAEGGYVTSDEERAGLEVASLRNWILGEVEPQLGFLAATAALVLLLTCANVATLLVAQMGRRGGELAVRSAIGGGRVRIARQLAVEVSMMCALGGAAALGLVALSLDSLASLLPPDLPRADAIGLTPGVVAFAAAAVLLTAALTGVVPALGARSVARGSGAGVAGASERERRAVRSTLVAIEMALAVVLVVGAGLMARTLGALTALDPGFEAEGVVTVRPSPPTERYPPGPELDAYYASLTDELTRLPGVESVGAIQFLPMTPGGWWSTYLPEGRAVRDDESRPRTAMRVVREGYFETMRIALRVGRALTEADARPEAEPAAVVNETFAAEAFPGRAAVGQIVDLDGTGARIVGVVADVRQSDLRTASHPEMYVPFGRIPWQRMHMVVRVRGDERAALAGVAAAARSVDPGVALLGPRPVRDVVGSTIGGPRLVTLLLAFFGFVGMALGAVGVYGVTSQAVAERRREIGIRVALGAAGGAVARSVVARGLVPVGVGTSVGLALAWSGRGSLEGLLYGVAPGDPRTFLAAPAVLVLVAIAALAVPARRAGGVDPARTLRGD